MDSLDGLVSLFAMTFTKAKNDATFFSKARANLNFNFVQIEESEERQTSPRPSQANDQSGSEDQSDQMAAPITNEEHNDMEPSHFTGPRSSFTSRKPTATVNVFDTQAMLPTALVFDLPEDLSEDQTSVWVEGPHGMIEVPVPSGYKPGDSVQVHIGPTTGAASNFHHAGTAEVESPKAARAEVAELAESVASASSGDADLREHQDAKDPAAIELHTKQDAVEEEAEAEPVLMVRVPEEAQPGDWVSFSVPLPDGT